MIAVSSNYKDSVSLPSKLTCSISLSKGNESKCLVIYGQIIFSFKQCIFGILKGVCAAVRTLYQVNFKDSQMDEMSGLFAILTIDNQMQRRNIQFLSVFCILFGFYAIWTP